MASDEEAAEGRIDRGLIALLAVVLLGAALAAPWHSAWTVDDRTYLEMSRGITLHGLPWLDNGPADRLPVLQARWDAWHGGHLWGTYPPVYPFLAAPVLAIGGVRAGIGFNFVLLLVTALIAADLGRRLLGRPLGGSLAAWSLVAATNAAAMTPVFSPYTAVLLGGAACLSASSRAVATRGGRAVAWSFAAGLAAGLTALSNFVGLGSVAALLAVTVFDPSRAGESDGHAMGGRASEGLRRALGAGAGLAIPLLAVSALNARRFGVANPFHASCVWASTRAMCHPSGPTGYGIGGFLIRGAPIVLAAGLGLLAWRRRGALRVAALLGVALCAWIARGALAEALSILSAFVIDPSHLLGGPSFPEAPDGLGHLSGPAVVKALLQGAPFLALAPLARPQGAEARRLAWLCAAAAAGHWTMLALRQGVDGPLALGWPFAHLRYNLPGLLPLTLLACATIDARRPGRSSWLLAAATALIVGGWLASGRGDLDGLRRIVLLRGSLMVAIAAVGAEVLARLGGDPSRRRVAGGAAAVALGLSAAINLGGDLTLFGRMRASADRRLDELAAVSPGRVALVGMSADLDPVLALRASRDVVYLDLAEVRTPAEFDAVLRHWEGESRPVFALVSARVAAALATRGLSAEPVLPSLFRLRRSREQP